jgi:hypothetical protein
MGNARVAVCRPAQPVTAGTVKPASTILRGTFAKGACTLAMAIEGRSFDELGQKGSHVVVAAAVQPTLVRSRL